VDVKYVPAGLEFRAAVPISGARIAR
jgi:hypothetical protein